MEIAMSMADVVVSRAGAITLSEIAIIGTPAILVPSPNVTDDHQTKNAQVFSRVNAATVVADQECSQKLYNSIIDLINDTQKRETFKENLQKLAKPKATVTIVDQIDQILNKSSHA
jgi:UDP-N-acetylglucosamine--N-acetylmuramyl-(pentapeptide) pyrophosphoryl-undecaprenol N-acetylglucosamine transferase